MLYEIARQRDDSALYADSSRWCVKDRRMMTLASGTVGDDGWKKQCEEFRIDADKTAEELR